MAGIIRQHFLITAWPWTSIIFANIWSVKEKLFKKRDLEEITTAYGNKFDMLNLQWIYRSKKYYHMSSADIYALLIPVHYRLSKNDITALVEASDLEEFRRALDTTYYKKRFPELAPEKLEKFYNLNLKTVIEKEARKLSTLSNCDLFLSLSQRT